MDYQRSVKEVLALAEEGEHWLSVRDWKAAPQTYQLVDLRATGEFAISHLEEAINIPAQELLHSAWWKPFIDAEKTLVLYAETPRNAIGSWLLLSQMERMPIRVLEMGYPVPSDDEGIAILPETERYDFQLRMKETLLLYQEELKANAYKPAPLPVKKIVPKKKKKVEKEEEGC